MGAEREARKERRVFVPKETFASKVSAPPNTFRMRPVALYRWSVYIYRVQNIHGTHCVALVVSDLGGTVEVEPAPFAGGEDEVNVVRVCTGVACLVDFYGNIGEYVCFVEEG